MAHSKELRMKAKAFWITCLFAFSLQAFFTVAFALDLPALTPPVDDQTAVGVAQQIWQLVVNKQYALALGPVVALIVFALRKWDKNIPKIGPQVDAFLNQPIVAFLLPTVVAAAGGLGTALAAGKPPIDAVGSVFEAAMGAVFTYVGIKKVAEQKAAGDDASAAITDKQKAVEEITKP